MKQSLLKIGLFIAISALLAGCDAWQNDIRLKDEARSQNLYEAIASNPDLSVFTNILQLTGYDKFLQEEQALTVFAPKNDVLTGVNLSDTVKFKEWIKNYIAYYAYYVDESGNFETGNIQMINKKNIPVNTAGISGAGIVLSNRASSNGVLHIINNVITDRDNILEYLVKQTGYEQIAYILSENKEIMDMDRSVQTGVDISGHPLYDTIWKVRNEFLENYPLGDETKAFNVLLLESNAFEKLKNKYAKYMKQNDADKQAREILRHITSDMILHPEDIDHNGRYLSMNGDSLLVDIDLSSIVDTFQASNGKVYRINDVDVKMYQNKIKTKIIEAENYTDRWDGQDGWEVRYRSWASGGKDVVLKGQTRSTFNNYYIWNPAGDSVRTVSETITFNMIHRANEGFVSKSNNSYLKFEPEMFSVPYEIYWRTYDDKPAHIYAVTGLLYATGGRNAIPLFTVNGTDTTLYTIQFPMKMEQKLLISFPGKPALRRGTDATISNNFTAYSLMASESVAGVSDEIQLTRYRATATDNMFMLATTLTATLSPYTTADDFGQNKTLKCPTYGNATIFVSNTVREKDTNAGVLFLDYIRLVPLVDPND